eukprot:g1655.t1
MSNARLVAVRRLMAARGVNALIVPSEDAHMSEYVRSCDMRRGFISNFDGSAGTAVITKNQACMWTDGRYFAQAMDQLLPGWELMRMGVKGTPSIEKWLQAALGKDDAVGYDPFVTSMAKRKQLLARLTKDHGPQLVALKQPNLVDEVWKGKEDPPAQHISLLDESYTGRSASEKLACMRTEMAKAKVDIAVVTALDEVAWLFNIRGSDVNYNPVAIAYAVVGKESASICINPEQVSSLKRYFDALRVDVVPYDSTLEHVAQAAGQTPGGAVVWLDENTCNCAIADAIEPAKVHKAPLPTAMWKAIKNDVELDGIRACHLRDGAALCAHFAWLEKTVMGGEDDVDELGAAAHLKATRQRFSPQLFRGLSFETIAGSGPNGAIIHYAPTEQTSRAITKDDMYLCDSGAQYLDGTTDVTRTMIFGTPTEHHRRCFTRVLQGHIALATVVFPAGTSGYKLDPMARAPLWRDGLDYRHGTGHGVGAFLNVHEGPQGIGSSPRSYKGGIVPRMTMTNEPGYYEDGAFGIRIENVMIAVEKDTKHRFDKAGRCNIVVTGRGGVA